MRSSARSNGSERIVLGCSMLRFLCEALLVVQR